MVEISRIYEPVHEGLSRVEEELKRLIATGSAEMVALLDHVLGHGGKRLRPALTLLVGKAQSCDSGRLEPMATAVELFHTATLVHDDTVDTSALRRGLPTVFNLWGSSRAVLFGDYLFAVAAEMAATTGNLTVVTLFAQTLRTVSAGELTQSLRGFDPSQTRQRYYDSIYSKTASLFVLATESAAALSGVGHDMVTSCRDYGFNLGMAFQITDDILDFVGAEEDLGKPVGSDLLRGVVTLPVILAIEENARDSRVQRLMASQDPASVEAVMDMASDPRLIDESYRIASDFCVKARQSALRMPEGEPRQSLLDLTEYVKLRRT